ncbi:MAG: universal stress protein [Candidatus Microthrix sp.]|nr:universal stress protein [Candidatus Microthrix sp.]
MSRVVVGVDASSMPTAALREALSEAHLRGSVLKVVSVWSYPPLSAEERLLTTASAVEAETIERVGETVDRLRHEGHNSELTIKVDVRQGAPGKVLIDLAVGCELLVVGRRDRSRLRHLVLGSVADQCVRHSPVPVMVVPSDWERPDRSGDVTLAVGMDFSDSANEALRWTLGEAERRNAAVRVVHSWEEPMLVGGDLMMAMPPSAALEHDAEERMDRFMSALDVPDGVSVTGSVRRGPPAQVLLEAAEDADMVVVGSRGLGGFAGLLLGSVARRVTHLAPCPVVVVPSENNEGRRGPDREPGRWDGSDSFLPLVEAGGQCGRLGSSFHAQLHQHVGDVVLDRFLCQVHHIGDLAIGHALADQLENALLLRAEQVDCVLPTGLASHAIERPPDRTGIQQ